MLAPPQHQLKDASPHPQGAHLSAGVVVAVCEVQVCGAAEVVGVDELVSHSQLHLPVVLQPIVAQDDLGEGRARARGKEGIP